MLKPLLLTLAYIVTLKTRFQVTVPEVKCILGGETGLNLNIYNAFFENTIECEMHQSMTTYTLSLDDS